MLRGLIYAPRGSMFLRWCRCRCRKRAVPSCTRAIYALGYQLLMSAWRILATGPSGINVALHAQVPPSRSMVVGSAVTMAGVKQALLGRRESGGGERGERHGHRLDLKIAHAQIFYPLTYEGLHDRIWDLVIIEGWFKMINVFIHEVRAIAYPRLVTILFYCLDPVFPGLSHTAAIDVDGFLTNSVSTQTFLRRSAPTALVPLAVDIKAFPFYRESPESGLVEVSHRESSKQGTARIVYVGAAGAMEYKEMLAWILREALPYGLDIYGSGWHKVPEFSAYWRGVLPEGELASVYGTALAVIGVTMDAQRLNGMINNRVFEVLSVGAPLISDHFPTLEALFGNLIFYVRQPGDVARHIERLLDDASRTGRNKKELNARRRRRTMIENSHSWATRVEEIISFAQTLPGSRLLVGGDRVNKEARCSRNRSCLTLALVVDSDLTGDITFDTTFYPALNLLKSVYNINWLEAPPGDGYPVRFQNDEWYSNERGKRFEERWPMQLPRDTDELRNYDAVWAVGRWGGSADRAVRAALEPGSSTGLRPSTRRLAAQLRGIVLWGELCKPNNDNNTKMQTPEGVGGRNVIICPPYDGALGLRWYDVVYCETDWDHTFLKRMAFDGAISNNLQQAWGMGGGITEHIDRATEMMATNVSAYNDILVVGTDEQVPNMLQALRASGSGRVALAVVVSPGDATVAARPGLSSILAATSIEVFARAPPIAVVSDLPQSLSVFIVETVEGSMLSPRPARALLVRGAEDVGALAEIISMAEAITIMATGQLRTWITLLTATSTRHDHWQKKLLFIDTDGTSSSGDARSTSLLDRRIEAWSLNFYARRLIAGMTRALCLGQGNSRISLVRPVGGGTTLVGISDTVTVEVLVSDFDVGRDGQWCITANRRTVLCVLGSSLTVDVHISSSKNNESAWKDAQEPIIVGMADGTKGIEIETNASVSVRKTKLVRVELSVELRSNMYQDVLFRGKPSLLLVDPSSSTTYGNGSCCYEETGHTIRCNRKEVSDDARGHFLRSAQDPYRTSIDVDDLLQTGSIVDINVESAHMDPVACYIGRDAPSA